MSPIAISSNGRANTPPIQNRRVKSISSMVRFGLRRKRHGLQRHPAFGAASRTDLFDLGMHRTGVARVLRGAGRDLRLGLPTQPVCRAFGKPRTTPGTAEIVGLAVMAVPMLRRRRGLHIHARKPDPSPRAQPWVLSGPSANSLRIGQSGRPSP